MLILKKKKLDIQDLLQSDLTTSVLIISCMGAEVTLEDKRKKKKSWESFCMAFAMTEGLRHRI